MGIVINDARMQYRPIIMVAKLASVYISNGSLKGVLGPQKPPQQMIVCIYCCAKLVDNSGTHLHHRHTFNCPVIS